MVDAYERAPHSSPSRRICTQAVVCASALVIAAVVGCEGDAGKSPGQTRVIDGTEDPLEEYGGARDEYPGWAPGQAEQEGNMHDYVQALAANDAPEAASEPAFAAQGPSPTPQPGSQKVVARAVLKDREGKALGTATFTPTSVGVNLEFTGRGLPPGEHGFHIHETGRCDPPDFKSAGGHFAPRGRDHGFADADGFHLGDMANLEVGADGTVSYAWVLPGVTLAQGGEASLFDADKSAIVLHAKPDDYRTDPSGASGARIACGVIEYRAGSR